jgi:malate synthase
VKAAPLRAVPPVLEVQVPRILDAEILSPQALGYMAALAQDFAPRLRELLAARRRRAPILGFLPETASIRSGDWHVGPIPRDLEERQVEITGPAEAKMILNGLNSGADVFMVDFEDSMSPTWANVVSGQRHLKDAVRRRLRFDDPASGKHYRLHDETAVLMVRPRGLHLVEAHATLDGEPLPAALFDFGLALFHNARTLLERGSGPYFYLPKLEHYLEARLWNEIFERAETLLGIPRASIRATVLIETLPAAFQMDEILYELRERSAGLNCGRWDYIFSAIKTRRDDPEAVFPDRGDVGMEQPFLRAYTQLAVKTCHRRGIHALGGMAAQIPNRRDPEANERSLAKVRADKEREAEDGHDGTWVAHPDLVPVARDAFRARFWGPNQLSVSRSDVEITEQDLLTIPEGPRTLNGLRGNVRVGLRYLESWLRGVGCVPLYGLMEDAATAEISRTQLWQWMRHETLLEDHLPVTPGLIQSTVRSEMERIETELGSDAFARGRFAEAERLFTAVASDPDLPEFLTLPSYAVLNAIHDREGTEPAIES